MAAFSFGLHRAFMIRSFGLMNVFTFEVRAVDA